MNLRKLVVATSFVAVSVVSAAGLVTPAYAVEQDLELNPIVLDTVPLRCLVVDGEFITQTTQGCDLAVDKQVSVNGGAYVDADTSPAAATAHVGDTVTWKITLSNVSSDPTAEPYGIVTVKDVLPAGVTLSNASVTTGTYASDDWVVDLTDDAILPATLTLTTTANATGLVQNTATLNEFNPCRDGCIEGDVFPYADADSANNSNDAWVDVQAKPVPQVLAATTTLVDTGSNSMGAVIVAASLIAAATFLGLATRRFEES